MPELFLGCLLTVAVFAMGFIFCKEQASRPAQQISQQETSSDRHNAQNPDAELTGSTWLTKDAAGFFTFGLVVVGGIQVLMFFIQLQYMRKGMDDATLAAQAARISAETAKEQVALTKLGIIDLERAYLAVGPTEIIVDFILTDAARARNFYVGTDPQELTVHLFIQNTGRTAATIKKVYGILTDSPPLGDTPFYPPLPDQPSETDLSVAAGTASKLDPSNSKANSSLSSFSGAISNIETFSKTREHLGSALT